MGGDAAMKDEAIVQDPGYSDGSRQQNERANGRVNATTFQPDQSDGVIDVCRDVNQREAPQQAGIAGVENHASRRKEIEENADDRAQRQRDDRMSGDAQQDKID